MEINPQSFTSSSHLLSFVLEQPSLKSPMHPTHVSSISFHETAELDHKKSLQGNPFLIEIGSLICHPFIIMKQLFQSLFCCSEIKNRDLKEFLEAESPILYAAAHKSAFKKVCETNLNQVTDHVQKYVLKFNLRDSEAKQMLVTQFIELNKPEADETDSSEKDFNLLGFILDMLQNENCKKYYLELVDTIFEQSIN